jgi:PleD family two-component response regulator
MALHAADSILIVAGTSAQAEQIQQTIRLRGFDRVKCSSFDKALGVIAHDHCDLVIIDTSGGQEQNATALASRIYRKLPMILVAERFDEDLFLSVYDAGAKDFLVKPLNPPYFMSRILLALENRRRKEMVEQKDLILQELNVLAPYSKLFSTEYFLRILKRETQPREAQSLDPSRKTQIALLIIHLEALDAQLVLQQRLRRFVYDFMGETLRATCRGADTLAEFHESKFAILLSQAGASGIQAIAQRLEQRLEGLALSFDNQNLTLHVRMGGATFAGCNHYEDLTNKALQALRLAAQQGKTTHIMA